MNKIYNEIRLGAEEPFTILHVTDVHLTETTGADSAVLRELAAKRRAKYPFSENILCEIERLRRETEGILLLTGDMMDFNSAGNFAKIKAFTKKHDCLFIAGNHDFRPFGGMEYDVPARRDENLSAVQALFGNDIRFFSKIVNGINIVGIDNCYYRFEQWQYDRLRTEVNKGLPVILAMHIPFYTDETYRLVVNEKRRYASQICVPEEKMTDYPPERYVQQKEDAVTREMYEYILHEKAIRLLVCGHIHKNGGTVLPSGVPQLITDTDTVRVITVW